MNNPPTVSVTNMEVAEGFAQTVLQVKAADPEGSAIAYALSGPDAAAFKVDAQGAVSFVAPPDYEQRKDANGDNVYLMTVIVTDAQGATASAEFTVKVTNLGAAEFVDGIAFSDITPTATHPVAAGRIATDRWLIRTLSVESGSRLDYDEFELRDPAGEGVDRGLQLTRHGAMIRGKYRTWVDTPDSIGSGSTQEYAWRMGKASAPYVSGGDDGDFAYSGFGHGRKRYRANGRFGASSIVLNAAGGDLSGAAVGSLFYGDKLDVLFNYDLAIPDGTYVADAVMLHSFSASGLLEFLSINVTGNNVAGNDSYFVMYPFRGDTIKPVGLGSTRFERNSGVSKPWGLSPMREIQFHYSSDGEVMSVLKLLNDAPLRREGALPYSFNIGDRFIVEGSANWIKFYGFAMSSDSSDQKRAFTLSGVYEGSLTINSRISVPGPR